MIKESGTELKNGTATFSGVNMNFDGEVFEGAELNAVFGGVKCRFLANLSSPYHQTEAYL